MFVLLLLLISRLINRSGLRVRVVYQNSENLKYWAPFKITIYRKKIGFRFFCTLSRKEWIKQEIKSVHNGYLD